MAANPLEGEIDFAIAGTTYKLCFRTKDVVLVEQLFSLGIGDLAQKMAHVECLAALFWASLQKHHGELDLLKTYDLLDQCEGGTQAVGEPVARALRFRLSRVPVDAALVTDTAE